MMDLHKKEINEEVIEFVRNHNDSDMWDIITRYKDRKMVWATVHEDLFTDGIMCSDILWEGLPELKNIEKLFGGIFINGYTLKKNFCTTTVKKEVK